MKGQRPLSAQFVTFLPSDTRPGADQPVMTQLRTFAGAIDQPDAPKDRLSAEADALHENLRPKERLAFVGCSDLGLPSGGGLFSG